MRRVPSSAMVVARRRLVLIGGPVTEAVLIDDIGGARNPARDNRQMPPMVCCPTCWEWSELSARTLCRRCGTPLVMADGRAVEAALDAVAHAGTDSIPKPPVQPAVVPAGAPPLTPIGRPVAPPAPPPAAPPPVPPAGPAPGL